MKKLMIYLFAMAGPVLSTPGNALDGTGTVEEIRVCTSEISGTFKQYLFFRLSDGNWFGSYGLYATSSNKDYGDKGPFSLVLLAYANDHVMTVRANYATKNVCGVTAGMIWDTPGDYITIKKP